MPRPGADRSLALLRDPYRFTAAERGRTTTEPFTVRLLGRRTHVVGGRDGAELFYDESRIARTGAVPAPLRNTLFGKGAVHGLDGEPHRSRKELFLRLLTDDAAADIVARAECGWRARLEGLGAGATLEVFATAVAVHADAVSGWAGIPPERRYRRMAHDLAATVDGFGSVGARHARARLARLRLDRWGTRLIDAVRAGGFAASGSPVQVVADYREGGAPLPARVAAVELINILRPTVAVAWFAAFAALHPGAVADADPDAFAHELRRYHPFVPVLAGRARTSFAWRGLTFRAGQRVLLDVYGTLHDPALWPEPGRFDPGRFCGRDPDPFTLIPQGGGEPLGHRCPGEKVTIGLITTATRVLSGFELSPAQDLSVEMGRAPTRPRSGALVTRRRG